MAAGLESGADFVLSKDLVSQPVEWRQRLEEILVGKDSRGLPFPVVWQRGTAESGVRLDWPEALNQAFRVAAIRLIGPEVLRIVVRRAFSQACVPSLAEANIARWMNSDGFLIVCSELGAALDSHAVATLVVSLARQMGRLLGAEASRPFREELAAVVPGLSQLPSH